MSGDTSWSLGVLVGLPVLGVLLLIAIGLTIFGVLMWFRGDYGDWLFLAVPSGVVAVIFALVVVLGFYPYKAEYHQWRTTSGEVTAVKSRILGSGDGINQRFVVRIEGTGYRSCDDTRCADVEVGDMLTVTCKRAWQFTGTDGYDCNFVDLRKKAAR